MAEEHAFGTRCTHASAGSKSSKKISYLTEFGVKSASKKKENKSLIKTFTVLIERYSCRLSIEKTCLKYLQGEIGVIYRQSSIHLQRQQIREERSRSNGQHLRDRKR